jgi:hypothetical protein
VVVTKVDCDTYEYPLPIEYCFDGTDCTQAIGKCWESPDGQPGSWFDSSTWEYDLSIRARAIDLAPIEVRIDPLPNVVVIGHEYDILWDYPNTPWLAARNSDSEALTLELVRYDDIDSIVGTIAEKIKPNSEKFHWKVDKSLTTDEPGVKYCIRITNSRVIGLSKPFFMTD